MKQGAAFPPCSQTHLPKLRRFDGSKVAYFHQRANLVIQVFPGEIPGDKHSRGFVWMGKGLLPAAVGGQQEFGQNFGVSPQEITAREIDLGVGAVVVGVAGKDVQLNALLFKSYLLIDKVNDLGIDLAGSQRGDVISYFFYFDLGRERPLALSMISNWGRS